MPLLFGPQDAFANQTERQVWETLRDALGDEDCLGANVRLCHEGHDVEVDLLVGIAGAGFVSLEVKGGEVGVDERGWWQRGRSGHARIDPVEQASRGKYAVQAYLRGDPRWDGRKRRWAHAVVLRDSRIDPDFALPGCPRGMVFDRDEARDTDRLLGGVCRLLDTQMHFVVPNAADVADLVAVMGGRFLPQRDLVAVALEREGEADRLTEQQALVLEVTRLLPRVEVRGGAGSGKTWLALEQARRLSADGRRVALVCYSRGLGTFLCRRTEGFKRRHRPAYVGTYHDLGRHWGADVPDTDSPSAEWDAVPGRMTRLAEDLADSHRFDALVVDEAQDLGETWWPPLAAALRGDDPGVYVFTDDSQRVFPREGGAPLDLLPLVLDTNLRNTREIAETFEDLAPGRMRLLGGRGPAVRLVECRPDEAVACADEELDGLPADWRPQDIALLTTGRRHPEHAARQTRGQDAYWASLWDEDQVFYGTVLGFKGLERRVVVLAVNERQVQPTSRERLYVGLSRARDQLVVCGDPDHVRAVAGERVLRRLRAGRA